MIIDKVINIIILISLCKLNNVNNKVKKVIKENIYISIIDFWV